METVECFVCRREVQEVFACGQCKFEFCDKCSYIMGVKTEEQVGMYVKCPICRYDNNVVGTKTTPIVIEGWSEEEEEYEEGSWFNPIVVD